MKRYFFRSALLILSINISAHSSEWKVDSKKYDFDLLHIAKQTAVFSKDFTPDYLEKVIQEEQHGALAQFYNAYIDKKLGSAGQTIEDFQKLNAFQIGQIEKSNEMMGEGNLPSENSLSLEQAKNLLKKSNEVSRNYIDQIPGACFLRSTHIAHELNQKYPNIPVIKIWLFGSFYNRADSKKRWNYHTAPAIPVRAEGKIQWMVFDTLLTNSGPLTLVDWVKETNQSYKFTSKIEVLFSAADKVGPFFGSTLVKMAFAKNGFNSINALFMADQAQD